MDCKNIIVELDGTVTKVYDPIGPYLRSRGMRIGDLLKPIERYILT
jgi:hypothetical protein